ncbi:MAG: hypothetical protein FJX78_01200 [Armatimonadetes bacterium]|nr:hypothetical protein [Armatimonadota bacterium]
MLWLFGGSLERGWRVRGYLPFLLLVTASSWIALWAGSAALGRSISLAGLWLPLSGIVYAWTLINQRQRILVYMALPVEARWLGVVPLVLLFFGFPFPRGAFALAGCGVAAVYVRWLRFGLLDWVRPTAHRGRASDVRRERGPANPIIRFQRRQRKRKFVCLMERSGLRDRDSK